MTTLVLALRGAAAIAVLVALAGGVPSLVMAGLAAAAGLWAALIAGASVPDHALGLVAARELVIGAAIGLMAGVPLLAAATAGRLVDLSRGARTQGPYAPLFRLLSAAVFVGIDGHVAVATAIATSFRELPPAGAVGLAVVPMAQIEPRVLASLAALVPIAVRLAIPWLITAAVVELAAGVAVRLAGRAAQHAPIGAAVPAALVMMTATLVGTLAVGIAVAVR
jgi:flagellar biosynthesis protein FliR